MSESNNENQKGTDQKNALEWAVFVVGLLLIAGVLGYWSYQAFYSRPSLPDLYVERNYAPTAKSPYRYRVVYRSCQGRHCGGAGDELQKPLVQLQETTGR